MLAFMLTKRGANKNSGNIGTHRQQIISYIGRINYNYDDRYLFSATVRRGSAGEAINASDDL